MDMQRRKRLHALNGAIREIVFGLEDSLVSTVGAVSGIAVGSGDRYIVILSGIVLVAVEAVSMAAGSFLSSKSAAEVSAERARQDSSRMLQERINDKESVHDFFARKGFTPNEVTAALAALTRERRIWLREVSRREHQFAAGSVSPSASALVMGAAYVGGGFLVFTPYFFLPMTMATIASVVVAFAALFTLGIWKASIAGMPKIRSGLEMVSVSLVAAMLGIGIGRVMAHVFGASL